MADAVKIEGAQHSYGLKIKSAPAANSDAPVNGLRFHTTNAAGFSETITKEAKISRPHPSKMGLREGDVLVVTRLDRLARLIPDLIDIEGRLKSKKAVLNILDPALDTSSSSGRLMFNIFGSVAQFEREIMLERQRIGMAKAKADGKCMGRKPTAFAHAELVRKYADEGLNPTDIAKKVGIGRASVYRILGAEQAHDIKMKDRLSRWGSRETAKGWIMGRRNRHGRSRAHLREVSEDFERDWQDERDWRDERDEVNVEEIADNRPSDSYIALQAEAETLRTDLQAAQAKVATLEAACRARWSTSSFIIWLFAAASIFGAAGYLARLLTE